MRNRFVRKVKKLSVFVIIFNLLICNLPKAYAKEYIVFGSYPQTEVTDVSIFDGAEFDKNGDTVINGEKYRRVYVKESPEQAMVLNAVDEDGIWYHEDKSYTAYFKYEPLYWEDMGGVLVSRDIIDCKPYDEQEYKEISGLIDIRYAYPASWENSSVRAISEALDCEVSWNDELRTVNIKQR